MDAIPKKKPKTQGLIANDRKYIIDFSSVQKNLENLDVSQCQGRLEQISAVIKTSNSGELSKNFIDIKNGQIFWQN